jgi:hypothetical protein
MPRIGFFTQNHKHFRFLNTLLETSARAFQPQTASQQNLVQKDI